jgi:catechol 2,3-dioxygenase-like lactoylglutathione lyase family enzyme
MSRLLGNPAHHCYVYPDFDAALDRLAAGGIGPFFVLDEVGGMGDYRGEQHPFSAKVAFVYSGDSCMEIISPKPGGISAYNEFLDRTPHGGLHHIAYYSADFDATLAMMAAAGKPLRTVVDMRDPESGTSIEIYCEPVGVENPVLYQLMRPGLFDPWFAAMREAAASWDGSDPFRDARPSMMAALERA